MMKQLLYLIGFALILSTCQQNTIPSRQYYQSKRGVVSAAHPLATKAGHEILAQGGNAADAAVAAAFALAVVEPSMSGLGGRLQAIIHTPDGQVRGIDATSQTPLAYDTAVFRPQRYGYTTIGIPGVVAGLCKLSETYGSLPLATVMAPAIRYAAEGFTLLPGEARRHSLAQEQLQEFAGSRQYFLRPDGSTWPAGSTFVQKDLAQTLRIIATQGRDGFYKGPIATKIAADMQANGACLALEDLHNYQAYDSEVVQGTYRGHDLYGLWLPSYGAITIEILQILEQFPMGALSEAERLRITAEAMRLAYADRRKQYLGDSLKQLILSSAYAQHQAAKIALNPVNGSTGARDNTPTSWNAEQGHTTHLSVAGPDGMVIALTQSLGPNMGSKVASPDLGFLYAVSLGAYLGMYEPGQRVSSHISPFLVTKDGAPYLGLGAAGGSRIVTAVAQVVSRVIDQGMSLDEALAAPRVFPDGDKTLLELHPGTNWSQETLRSLKAQGLLLESIPDPARFGRVHAVLNKNGKWTGAADPDWEGAVW
jgi:gamma-glutamyltranspeptidase/glutathione hydrolase